MHVTLRAATIDDTPLLHELYAATRAAELNAWGWSEVQRDIFVQTQFQAQQRHYEMQFPRAEYSIICVDEQPVGRIMVDRQPDELRLVDLALLPAFRNRQIGTTLLRRLRAEGATRNLPVHLHVLKDSPALRLYERLGFVIVADAELYWHMQAPVTAERTL